MQGANLNSAATAELKKSVLYTSLKKCKNAFWFIFWFSFAINLLMLFLPIYTSQVLDRVLSSGSISTLIILTVITLFAFVCAAILETCRSFIMMRIADWLDKTVTPNLISHSVSLTSVKNSTSSGEVIRDLGVIKNFITGFGIISLFDAPWAVLYLITIFMIHPITGCIATVGIITLFLMAVFNELATKRVIHESNEENIKNINSIDVATRNAEVVEAMGMLNNIINDWSEKNTANRKLQTVAQSRSNIIMGITKFIRFTLQISVMGFGAMLAIFGYKTTGGIIAASILMGRALAPFESAINTWKMLTSARISYRRLQILLLISPKRHQSMKLPVPHGKLLFDRVFFTPYNTNKPTIKGISFFIDAGEIVGVVGASASGKSTIAKLAVGVWKPVSGVVRLDGADVYTWNREEFGQHVGYLPQDVELFNASVKTNISRMDTNPNPERVIKAAKIVGIHDLILSLPNGYDTLIGNNSGTILSGGQKQMLGLARAFYGDIKLLVLDEPNANLDGNGENCLAKSLYYAKVNKITVLMITHKIQILGSVDKIIIMNDGNISASGNRDEILSKIIQHNNPPKPQQTKANLETESNMLKSTTDDEKY